MKGFILTVLLGLSINVQADFAMASNWLTSSVRNSAYSHYYAAIGNRKAKAYAAAARNDASNACVEARVSHAWSLTYGAWVSQYEACNAFTNLSKEISYWGRNRSTSAFYGRQAEINQAAAIEWINFEIGYYGNY